ncbi:hypothetical protein [Geopseudomonas aromaticivorans]
MARISVATLEGAELALWAARAAGVDKRRKVVLYVSGPCLYRDLGQGAEPFPYRPDSTLRDAADLLWEMSEAGEISFSKTGAKLSIPGHGLIAFDGRAPEAITRCYVAWKMGGEFDAELQQ